MSEQIGLDFGAPGTRILNGLIYEEPMAGSDPDAEGRIQAEMSADFPQYGWSVLRQFYKHWFIRNSHRERCETCVGGGSCEIDGIYTRSLDHALKIISERKK